MTEPVVAAKAPAKVTLEAGKDYWWCACGQSKNAAAPPPQTTMASSAAAPIRTLARTAYPSAAVSVDLASSSLVASLRRAGSAIHSFEGGSARPLAARRMRLGRT